MKNSKKLKFIIGLSMSSICTGIFAQDLILIADYPLIENLTDITGNHGDVFLEGNPTAPTQPSKGIELCNNNIYLSDSGGQNIQTPVFNGFDRDNFEVEVEFKPVAFPDASGLGQSTVISGGKFSRYIGISINSNGLIGLDSNNGVLNWSSTNVLLDNYYTGKIRYNYGSTQLYINNAEIINVQLSPLILWMDGSEFSTTDWRIGKPFNGCIKNLKINSTTLIFKNGYE